MGDEQSETQRQVEENRRLVREENDRLARERAAADAESARRRNDAGWR